MMIMMRMMRMVIMMVMMLMVMMIMQLLLQRIMLMMLLNNETMKTLTIGEAIIVTVKIHMVIHNTSGAILLMVNNIIFH